MTAIINLNPLTDMELIRALFDTDTVIQWTAIRHGEFNSTLYIELDMSYADIESLKNQIDTEATKQQCS